MTSVPPFPESQIQALAISLGECGKGTDISRVLDNLKMIDGSGESTKWKRLYWVFLESQKQYKCANHILNFIQSFLSPVRFVGRSEEFEERRQRLNTILVFSGLEYGEDGKFRQCQAARTLGEAEKRLKTIQKKFPVKPVSY